MKCYSCNGKGFYTQMIGAGSSRYVTDQISVKKKICTACNGTGKPSKNNLSKESI